MDLSGLQGGSGGAGGAPSATSATGTGTTSTGAPTTGTGTGTGTAGSSTGATTSASTGSGNPLCGNGTIDGGEECDDSNMTDGDGCSSGCSVECSAPAGFSAAYKDPSTHHCYALYSNTNNAADSADKCTIAGQSSELAFYPAILRTMAEISIVETHLAPSQGTWVGASNGGGSWVWVDGTAVSASVWAPSQPGAGTPRSAQLTPAQGGLLSSVNPATDGWMLCERGPHHYADP